MTPTLKAKIKEVLEDYQHHLIGTKAESIARFGDCTTWAKSNIEMYNKDIKNVKQILEELTARTAHNGE